MNCPTAPTGTELDDFPPGTIDTTPGIVLGRSDTGDTVTLGPGSGHTLLVAWPGLGATSTLRTLAAQYARRGTQVDILDVSGQHAWARGQQRVRLHEDGGAIHRHLHQLAGQVREGRKSSARVVLIESDQTINTLLRFRRHPPPGSTALDTLTTVLAGGRMCGIRVVLACRAVPAPLQHLARDLFTTRLLALPTQRTWQIAGTPGKAAPADEPYRTGRMHLVAGPGHTPVRLLRLTPLQAAHLAATPAPASGPRRLLRVRPPRRPQTAPAASTFQTRMQGARP